MAAWWCANVFDSNYMSISAKLSKTGNSSRPALLFSLNDPTHLHNTCGDAQFSPYYPKQSKTRIPKTRSCRCQSKHEEGLTTEIACPAAVPHPIRSTLLTFPRSLPSRPHWCREQTPAK